MSKVFQDNHVTALPPIDRVRVKPTQGMPGRLKEAKLSRMITWHHYLATGFVGSRLRSYLVGSREQVLLSRVFKWTFCLAAECVENVTLSCWIYTSTIWGSRWLLLRGAAVFKTNDEHKKKHNLPHGSMPDLILFTMFSGSSCSGVMVYI